jgi:hypothetical protein
MTESSGGYHEFPFFIGSAVVILPEVPFLFLTVFFDNLILKVALIYIPFLYIGVLGFLFSVLTAIFQVALYRFCLNNKAPAEFPAELMARCFAPK